MVRKAVSDGGAEVIVTPEGILEGYVIEEANTIKNIAEKNIVIERFKVIAEPLDGPYIKKACNLANELNIFFIFGFLESRGAKLFNTAILVDPDGDIIGRYSKTHFAEGYVIKPETYTPGDEYPVFNTPFGKIGIIICYDRQLPEPARIMALKGAQILIVPAYGSYTDENGWNTALMRTRAYENKFPVIYCNPFQSLLIDQNGNIKAIGNAGEIVYYEVNTSPGNYDGRFKNRRSETYQEIFNQSNTLK
jgi:predicted amidohydrolase